MKTYFLYYGACTKMCPRQHYILKLSKHYIHTYKQSLWMCSPFLLFAMCFNNNTEVEVYSYFAVEVASVLCIWNRCANFGLKLEFRCFCSHFLFNWLSLHWLSLIAFWKFYLKSIRAKLYRIKTYIYDQSQCSIYVYKTLCTRASNWSCKAMKTIVCAHSQIHRFSGWPHSIGLAVLLLLFHQ